MMRHRRLLRSFATPTMKLAGTYLAIIMIMSIGFSFEFYHTSYHELGRQLPPDSLTHQDASSPGFLYGQPSVFDFVHQRIQEGRSALQTRLILLNVSALLIGSAVSYVLARRSLQPIERAMEAQAQFVSDASHELRTPLTAVQTTNEVFLRKPKVTLAQAKAVIVQNTEDIAKLKALSDGLLNLAQDKTAPRLFDAVELQDVVGEAMNQVVAQASLKDVAVHDTVPAKLKVLAEERSLVQVVVILLDNAVKYSNAGGSVYVTGHQRGKYVSLEVRDEGIGIRASDLPHIFRRFYRADTARGRQSTGGYGLGLAIAKRIVEQHEGTITVQSRPDVGTTFTVRLLRG